MVLVTIRVSPVAVVLEISLVKVCINIHVIHELGLENRGGLDCSMFGGDAMMCTLHCIAFQKPMYVY